MRRTRGGSSDKDVIDSIPEVLGKRLIEFHDTLQQGLDAFRVKDMAPRPDGADDKDFHPNLADGIIGITAALNALEIPDVKKLKVREGFSDKAGESIDALFNEAPKDDLKVEQFLNNVYSTDFKQILPGINLFSYTSPEKNTDVLNLVIFLYKYISNLDIKEGDGGKLINFLSINDNLNYNRLVNNVVEQLKTVEPKLVYNDEAFLYDAVIRGTIPVANKIISELKSASPFKLSTSEMGAITTNIDLFDGTSATATLGEYKGISDLIAGMTNVAPLVLYAEIAKLKNIHTVDAAATLEYSEAVYGPGNVDKIIDESLYNPLYLDTGKVSDEYKSGAPAPGSGAAAAIVLGGSSKFRMSGGATVDSAFYLYGPAITAEANKRFLSTVVSGTKLIFLDPNYPKAVKGMYDLLSKIQSISPQRIAALVGFVDYVIRHKIDTAAAITNTNDKTGIKKSMKDAVDNYNKYISRSKLADQKISTIEKNKDTYKQLFLNNFLKYSIGALDYDTATPANIMKRTAAASAKPTLNSIPQKKFYEGVILPNKDNKRILDILSEYIQLVDRTKPNEPALSSLVPSAGTDLDTLRYNVRKGSVGGMYNNFGQYGGAKNYGEIIFIQNLPDIPADDEGKLWFGFQAGEYFLATELNSKGIDVLQQLARQVYSADLATIQTINFITSKPIDFGKTVTYLRQSTGINTNLKNIWEEQVKKWNDPKNSPSTPGFDAEFENQISTFMFKDRTFWRQVQNVDGTNNFVRFDETTGEIVTTVEEPKCYATKAQAYECTSFLQNCALNKDPTFNEECDIIVKKFQFGDLRSQDVADEVLKMNPKVAYMILKKFHFGEIIQDDTLPSGKTIKRYKMQKVTDWVKTVSTYKNYFRDNEALIKDIIANVNLLKYLSILVEWVNANPQVMNMEEDMDGNFKIGLKIKKAEDSYNTYTYYNYNKEQTGIDALRSGLCGLQRMKNGIINQTLGVQPQNTINNLAASIRIQAPLNTYAFQTAMPGFGFNLNQGIPSREFMFGGGELDEQLSSYLLFKNIFEGISKTTEGIKLRSTAEGTGVRKIKISPKTDTEIQKKLLKFKTAEEELRKSLKLLILKNKLYFASEGAIYPFKIENDDDFIKVLQKHPEFGVVYDKYKSNAQDYNTQATKLVDVFQTIYRAIIGKFEEGSVTNKHTDPSIFYH